MAVTDSSGSIYPSSIQLMINSVLQNDQLIILLCTSRFYEA